MGLDMYLKATRYVSGYSWQEKDQQDAYSALLKVVGLDAAPCPNSPGAEISLTVAYWRKANAVHKWFVDNCQDGEDDCRNYYVSREQLQALLDICKDLLANKDKAGEVLPPQSGFFFGSTEVDECYWEDIQITVDQLTAVLANDKLKDFSFAYHSSW